MMLMPSGDTQRAQRGPDTCRQVGRACAASSTTMMMKLTMVARWLWLWGDAVVQVCECLWSAMGHASLGYGSGRSININIIATACAITCDINDAVGWGRGRECQRDGRTCPSLGHVYKLPFGAALARCFGAFDTRLSALQICSSVSLYLRILYLVSCILYLVSVYLVSAYLLCVCSPTDGFYLHFALECAVTPLLFTSTALRRFIFVFISSADSRYIAGYSVHMAYTHTRIHRYT